jgi:hypothetical protein
MIFLNNPYNLKIVLTQLNHECFKIRFEALILLHEFFVDIDNLDGSVITLILDNKKNFYLLFEYNKDIFNTADAEEKKDFILCELERIDSLWN